MLDEVLGQFADYGLEPEQPLTFGNQDEYLMRLNKPAARFAARRAALAAISAARRLASSCRARMTSRSSGDIGC